jgi:hypothetical protein
MHWGDVQCIYLVRLLRWKNAIVFSGYHSTRNQPMKVHDKKYFSDEYEFGHDDIVSSHETNLLVVAPTGEI